MINMDLDGHPIVPLDAAPAARLTEDALRQHTLEDMRRNGIPSEGLSERPCSLRESFFQREEAKRKANGEFQFEESRPSTTTTRRNRRLQYEPDQQSHHGIEENVQELIEKDPRIFDRAPTPATTIYTGHWKRETEYEGLQNELREATKRNLDIHPYKNKPLSNSQDFLSEPTSVRKELAWDDTEPSNKSKTSCSEFLSDLPPHTVVVGFSELGVYMSGASYVVSLGGTALPDLKYGIIIVPAGDESLLFKGYGDHADMPADFRAEIYAKSREVRKQVFAEELEMCGRYIPRPGRGIEDFRLPPMEEPEKLFYAQRVRERRARHRELYGTRRSSDPGSQPGNEAGKSVDEYSVPGSRWPSEDLYMRRPYSPVPPPNSEVIDGLRRLFNHQEEKAGLQQEEMHHPDKLTELAQYLRDLADGRVRENPGLDEEVWNKMSRLLPFVSLPSEEEDTAADIVKQVKINLSETT